MSSTEVVMMIAQALMQLWRRCCFSYQEGARTICASGDHAIGQKPPLPKNAAPGPFGLEIQPH